MYPNQFPVYSCFAKTVGALGNDSVTLATKLEMFFIVPCHVTSVRKKFIELELMCYSKRPPDFFFHASSNSTIKNNCLDASETTSLLWSF